MGVSGYYPYRKPKPKKKSNIANPYISRESFVNYFLIAMENDYKFIAVIIKDDRLKKPEIIINMAENMEEKFKYYLDAYDDVLTLKTCEHIRIIGVTFFDEFAPDIISPIVLR